MIFNMNDLRSLYARIIRIWSDGFTREKATCYVHTLKFIIKGINVSLPTQNMHKDMG
jgi:hypothetical protein